MEWGNLRNWFSESPLERERRETRAAWEACERLWQASPGSKLTISELSTRIMYDVVEQRRATPATAIYVALAMLIFDLLYAEDCAPIDPAWRAIENDPSTGVEFREYTARRRRWAADFDRQFAIVSDRLVDICNNFLRRLPEACFREVADGDRGLEVPLIDLLDDPIDLIEDFLLVPYDPKVKEVEVFRELNGLYQNNYLVTSGYPPDLTHFERPPNILQPRDHKGKSPAAIADLYLAGTPFRDLLELPVPFAIAEEARFEHCHIVGGTGHGKTQLMQRMIHADLVKAQTERRSVVVIDSQGDLINKLSRLALFDPDADDGLADRLVMIDPADIEFPAALNLFDAHLDRVREYRPVDRERVLNGVIELYETFFGSMLGAELTQKQGVIFRYLARLMISIPGATIHTLMQLMECG